jgi:putative drug exporter of the RND superfamily
MRALARSVTGPRGRWAPLPLEELVQIGATVAAGVLLDTFLVRSLLIPAITYLCGDRAWWPSPGARIRH